jgi:GNAT superfamily N-acetyltransferase
MTPGKAAEVFREVILPRCDLWVATEKEWVAAFLAMRGSSIDRMYVAPERWNEGWGGLLMAFAKQRSPEGLELHTHRQNTAACRFYEKHGFRAVRFGISPPPENAPDVEYWWRQESVGPGG